ncbi:MAG: tetratricopeptide repeat-containing sensor histidine kinase [Bacteroidetes bacterium]|nr:tetratricopeptide repeat-containing sensor histidine kinase [Bacteroidota bacterium]
MTDTVQKLLDKAESEQLSGNRKEAESIAQKVLAIIENAGTKLFDIVYSAKALYIIAVSFERRGMAEKALPHAETALEFIKQTDNKILEECILRILGNIHWNLSNYPVALDYYNRAILISVEFGFHSHLADVTGNIGNIYWNLADYQRALEYYHKALALNEQLENKNNIIINIGNIANVYSELNDQHKALEYYHKALDLANELGNKRSIAINTGNIGTTYADMHLYPRALEYFNQALELAIELDNKQFIANNTNSIGLAFFYLGDYSHALEYLQNALSLSEQLNDTLGIAINLANIGNIYSAPDFDGYNFEKAEELLLNSIKIHQELGTKKEEYETRKTLVDLYKHNNLYEQALSHLEIYHQVFLEVQSEEAKLTSIRESMNRQLIDLERDKTIAEHERELEYLRNVELVAVNEQVTQQNIKLEWLNQEKNEFLGIAAHDLKNPLVGIIMTAELIVQYTDKFTMDMIVDKVTLIKQSALRMKEIISNILDSNAIERGEIRLNSEQINVVEIINRIISSYDQSVSNKSLQVIQEFSHSTIWYKTDRSLFQSVIENIFSNSIKYSPNNKRIWVNTIKKGNCILISIRDEGQGLTSDDMSKLFGKFSKLSARPTAGENSTGLGLSIVKKLVELMNGRVWAESKGKGFGAEFFVELSV